MASSMDRSKARGAVLITGAGSGIGAAIASAVGRIGHPVCLTYFSNREKTGKVAASVRKGGARTLVCRLDVRDEKQIAPIFDRVEQELGPVHYLINNAGVTGGFARTFDLQANQIDDVFATNVRGPMLCCKEAVQRMRKSKLRRGGVIINVSSTSARTGGTNEWVHYAASKAALNLFTLGLAKEVAPFGIRAIAVAPGLIDTPLHKRAGDANRPHRLRKTVPMGRIGKPSEIADTVLWLMSAKASYVTGTIIEVSGGR